MADLNKILEYRSAFNYFPKSIGINSVELSEDRAIAVLTIDQNHLNPNNTVHGGVLYTLADTVSGMLVCNDGYMHTTVSGTIEYANPTLCGDTVTAEATFIKKGRKISYLNVDIKNSESDLMCFATFTYYNLEFPYNKYHKDEF